MCKLEYKILELLKNKNFVCVDHLGEKLLINNQDIAMAIKILKEEILKEFQINTKSFINDYIHNLINLTSLSIAISIISLAITIMTSIIIFK